MNELRIGETLSPAVTHSHHDLALVREACVFLTAADPGLASSLSVVIRPECCTSSALAAVAERIAEEYGLHTSSRAVGESLVVAIGRAATAPGL